MDFKKCTNTCALRFILDTKNYDSDKRSWGYDIMDSFSAKNIKALGKHSTKKIRDYLGIFPNMGGGLSHFPNPKQKQNEKCF